MKTKHRSFFHALSLGAAVGVVASIPLMLQLPVVLDHAIEIAPVVVLTVAIGVRSGGNLIRRFNLERLVFRRFVVMAMRRSHILMRPRLIASQEAQLQRDKDFETLGRQ